MFELKKIRKQWLIRPSDGQFKQLKLPVDACHVEVLDNFLVVDDVVFELKARGNIAYVEKLQSIAIPEESADSACCSKGDITVAEGGNIDSAEKLQGISLADGSDEPACYSEDNITSAECEEVEDKSLSTMMEMGQTEYDSLEAGQTEETSIIETVKGDAKDSLELSQYTVSPLKSQVLDKQICESYQLSVDSTSVGVLKQENVFQKLSEEMNDHEILFSKDDALTSKDRKRQTEKRRQRDSNNLTEITKLQTYTINNLRVYVYEADILILKVDCIVNAANENLAHGGGVSAVIQRAAGSALAKESREYITIFGVPQDLCVHQYAKATIDYSQNSKGNANALGEIHFAYLNGIIIQKIQQAFSSLISDTSTYDSRQFVEPSTM